MPTPIMTTFRGGPTPIVTRGMPAKNANNMARMATKWRRVRQAWVRRETPSGGRAPNSEVMLSSLKGDEYDDDEL
jgi:hypothetical protein